MTITTPKHNLTPAERFKILKERRKALKEERRRRLTAAKMSLKTEDSACNSNNSPTNSDATKGDTDVVPIKQEQEEQTQSSESSFEKRNINYYEKKFHERLEELKAYKREHGHLKVQQKENLL